MEELRRYKRTDIYQTYKCHVYWSWNPSYTLCGKLMKGENAAKAEDTIDCYGCLNAIERIEQEAMAEVVVH